VLATAGVDSVIRANDAAKEQQWKPVFKDEWPARRTFPSRIVRDGESVTFDGAVFTVHALGPGESHQDSYWVLRGQPQTVFIGDVGLNQVHAYTADGHTASWLANIERLRDALRPDAVVYTGHGEPGGPDMLAWESSYLTTYRAAVAGLARGGAALDSTAKVQLVARMKQFLPSDRLEMFIALGADPVAAELARARGR
jgi:glyoxylase-like metal-dependent hydrolase (beta-lactamase superfamily II)